MRPGTTMREVLGHSVARGNYRHLNLTPEQHYQNYAAALTSGKQVSNRHLARRAHHPQHASADAAGRLGRDLRGHHRAPSRRAEHRPHGAARRADRSFRTACSCSRRMEEGLERGACRTPSRWRCSISTSTISRASTTRSATPIGDKLLQVVADRITRRGARGGHDRAPRRRRVRASCSVPRPHGDGRSGLARRLVATLSRARSTSTGRRSFRASASASRWRRRTEHRRSADEVRRPRALSRQGGRARHLPLLRAGHGRAHPGAPHAGARPAPARSAPANSTLVYQPQINLATNRGRRDGGAAALESSDARHRTAGRVHPAGRRNRPDHAARRMGAARQPAPRRRAGPIRIKVAVNLSPVQFRNRGFVSDGDAGALAARDFRPGGWNWRSPRRCCSRTTRRSSRCCISCASSACRDRDGRFRHRLLVAELPALASRSTSSRSTALFIQRHRPQPRQRGHHPRDRGPWRQSRRSRRRPKASRRRSSSRSCVRRAAPRCRGIWSASRSRSPSCPR